MEAAQVVVQRRRKSRRVRPIDAGDRNKPAEQTSRETGIDRWNERPGHCALVKSRRWQWSDDHPIQRSLPEPT